MLTRLSYTFLISVTGVAGTCLLVSHSAKGQSLYAVGPWLASDGAPPSLLSVNPSTGAATVIGETGVASMIDITVGSNQELYAATFDRLYTINPQTGSASFVHTLSAYLFEGDFAYRRQTGVTYAVASDFFTDSRLYTVNLSTGTCTLIGSMGLPGRDISGLAFDNNGMLYAIHDSALSGPDYRVASVNPATGLATHVATLGNVNVPPGGERGVIGFDFDPSTNLGYFTTGYDLFTWNSTSFDVQRVGSFGVPRVSGLLFVPEPRTVYAMSVIALWRLRRRRAARYRNAPI